MDRGFRSISHAGQAEIEIVKRLFAAFARRDADAVVAFMDPDVRFFAVTGRVARGGKPYEGHAGFREYLADVEHLWDALDVAADRFEAVTDAVVTFGEVRARGGAGEMREPVVWTWRFRDGLLIEGRVHSDEHAARAALGLPVAEGRQDG